MAEELNVHFSSVFTREDTNVRSPNSVIFVRFMFPTKSMPQIRRCLKCNIIEWYISSACIERSYVYRINLIKKILFFRHGKLKVTDFRNTCPYFVTLFTARVT